MASFTSGAFSRLMNTRGSFHASATDQVGSWISSHTGSFAYGEEAWKSKTFAARSMHGRSIAGGAWQRRATGLDERLLDEENPDSGSPPVVLSPLTAAWQGLRWSPHRPPA